jgi:hypothetical protein
MTFVCYFPVRVVQLAVAVDCIELPLSIIKAAVCIVVPTKSMSLDGSISNSDGSPIVATILVDDVLEETIGSNRVGCVR